MPTLALTDVQRIFRAPRTRAPMALQRGGAAKGPIQIIEATTAAGNPTPTKSAQRLPHSLLPTHMCQIFL